MHVSHRVQTLWVEPNQQRVRDSVSPYDDVTNKVHALTVGFVTG